MSNIILVRCVLLPRNQPRTRAKKAIKVSVFPTNTIFSIVNKYCYLNLIKPKVATLVILYI